MHEPRMRRIVFSIVFSQYWSQALLVFKFTKSRRNFYTQIECRSFHAAKVNSRSSQHPPRLRYHGQFRLSSRSGRRFGLRLFQKSQKSLTGFCAQFLGIQRPIMIWICRSETLLDDREILVLRERSIVVRIGIGELFRSQSAARSLTTSCVRLELRSTGIEIRRA